MKSTISALRAPALVLLLGLLLGLAACGPDSGDDDPGGSCTGLLAGDLVITEIFADAAAPPEGGSGADDGQEWFEIYNASDHAIVLAGITIVESRPDGSSDHSHVMQTDVVLGAGVYLVLGNAAPDQTPTWVNYGYGGDLGELPNTNGGRLVLRCGDATIDEVLYDAVTAGRATGFDGGVAPDYTGNDDLAAWCEADPSNAASEFAPGNFGSPGTTNPDCEVTVTGMCLDGDTLRPTVTPAPGDLVITEVMPSPDPAADDTAEWFEVLVGRDVDLNDLGLDREPGDSRPPDRVGGESCKRVTAGTRVVFARSLTSTVNGMLPRVDGTFGFSMTGDSNVRVVVGDTVLDAFAWTDAPSGKSLQLDPDAEDPEGNDDQRFWCDGSGAYGDGGLGSPGAANTECVIEPAEGDCVDVDTGVERPIVRPTAGQLIITEIMANPAGTDSIEEWIEVLALAPVDLNGLALDRTDDSAGADGLEGLPGTETLCRPVAAGRYAILAHNFAGTGLPAEVVVDATFGLSLVDPTAIQLVDGATVIDAVTAVDGPSGDASAQLDPAFLTAAGNDDAGNFCASTAPYGGGANKGTPELANASCP